jgi:hypothetical protein
MEPWSVLSAGWLVGNVKLAGWQTGQISLGSWPLFILGLVLMAAGGLHPAWPMSGHQSLLGSCALEKGSFVAEAGHLWSYRPDLEAKLVELTHSDSSGRAVSARSRARRTLANSEWSIPTMISRPA